MKEAILITNVKVDRIPWEKRIFIEHCELHPFQPASRAEYDAGRHMRTELIERRELLPFHVARPRPLEHYLDAPQMEMDREIDHYYIYADKDVQEKLGMVYEVWADLKEQVDKQRKALDKLHDKARQRKAEGWWKRVHRGMVNEL